MFALIREWPTENANMRKQRELQNAVSVLAVGPTEAARLAGVGRTTVYEAIGAGKLKSVKIGKRRLITIEALRAWLLAHEVAA
jgi:excisionase family DNA binding protein